MNRVRAECPVPPSGSTLAQRLRAETLRAHAALDRHPVLRPLATGELSPEQYATALAALHGLLAGTQTVLAHAADSLDPVRTGVVRLGPTSPGMTLDALSADLSDLAREPWCPLAVPPPASLADWVGMTYVLEGSVLGGRFIAARLVRDAAELPRRHFDSAAAQAGRRWPAFWRIADGLLDESGHPAAVVAACALFDRYRAYLDGGELCR